MNARRPPPMEHGIDRCELCGLPGPPHSEAPTRAEAIEFTAPWVMHYLLEHQSPLRAAAVLIATEYAAVDRHPHIEAMEETAGELLVQLIRTIEDYDERVRNQFN